MKILCVHGINTSEVENKWEEIWQSSFETIFSRPDIDCTFVKFNELVDKEQVPYLDYTWAIRDMLDSYIEKTLEEMVDWQEERLTAPNILNLITEKIKGSFGMVATWVLKPGVRQQLRDILTNHINSGQYDIIYAHSFGTLVAYDTLINNPVLGKNKVLITSGSQLLSPFIASKLKMKIYPVNTLKHWYYLYNPHDLILFADKKELVELDSDNRVPFSVIYTPFAANNVSDPELDFMLRPGAELNHNAEYYLNHINTEKHFRDL